MNILIEQNQTDLNKHSRKNIQQRVDKVLQRFSHKLTSTKLIFKDTNGPKGGIDKECTVQAKLVHGGEIIVVKRGSSIPQALFRALRGLRNIIIRRTVRERQLRYGIIKKRYMVVEQ